MRTVYVSGEYVDATEARVSIFDRGFLFGDAIYEVVSVLDSKLCDFEPHWERLQRSANEIDLACPITRDELLTLCRTLVTRNAVQEGLIYLQLSRGPAERDFAYPQAPEPTLIAFTQSKPVATTKLSQRGMKIIVVPDVRWARCDIKTVGLLAASMAKQNAVDSGADDAWMERNGLITEGSASNAYIVDGHGVLVTRHLGNEILAGVTRAALLKLAATQAIKIEERPIRRDELASAKEAFATAASMFVTPVVSIDGHRVGDGTPGPVATALRDAYIAHARATAI